VSCLLLSCLLLSCLVLSLYIVLSCRILLGFVLPLCICLGSFLSRLALPYLSMVLSSVEFFLWFLFSLSFVLSLSYIFVWPIHSMPCYKAKTSQDKTRGGIASSCLVLFLPCGCRIQWLLCAFLFEGKVTVAGDESAVSCEKTRIEDRDMKDRKKRPDCLYRCLVSSVAHWSLFVCCLFLIGKVSLTLFCLSVWSCFLSLSCRFLPSANLTLSLSVSYVLLSLSLASPSGRCLLSLTFSFPLLG
jgi:hypothetical protein